jgi:flagellar protein FlbD
MIKLHRLGHQAEEFQVNQELIVSVEANPDTVITLATGTKIIVIESPDRVAERVRDARAEVLAEAVRRRREQRERELRAARVRQGDPALAAVPDAPGER